MSDTKAPTPTAPKTKEKEVPKADTLVKAAAEVASTTAGKPVVSASLVEIIKSNFKAIALLFDKNIIETTAEIGHLSPVFLIFGSLFISLVTLNYPIFMLSASSAEAMLLYNLIYNITGYAVSPKFGLNTDAAEQAQTCGSYFKKITPSRFNYFITQGLRHEFPNQALYFISFGAAYLIQSMVYMSEECSELGPQYSSRTYLAILTAVMFIALYILYLTAYGCDSLGYLLMTVLLGCLVGYLISVQNFLLLGKNGINVMFLPTLGRKSGMDYICVTTNPASESSND